MQRNIVTLQYVVCSVPRAAPLCCQKSSWPAAHDQKLTCAAQLKFGAGNMLKKKIYIADHLGQKFQRQKKTLEIQLVIIICESDKNITQNIC